MSIFRQLTSGLKFDKKKYRHDAEKFGLISSTSQDKNDVESKSVSLDNVIVPDSNMPTPEDSSASNSDEENEFKILSDISLKDKKKSKKKVIKTKLDLAKLHQEKVNHFRNIHRIHIKGDDIPDPVDSWDKLRENYGVTEDLLNILKSQYEKPTPVQMQAIPMMLDRRESLVCAPTGSGKTVSYLLPLVHHLREPRNKKGFRGVIVAPTRELADQIYRECQKLCEPRKLRPFIIDKVAKCVKKVSGQKLDILITTPNRLVYMIKSEEIQFKNVEWLIVDESVIFFSYH